MHLLKHLAILLQSTDFFSKPNRMLKFLSLNDLIPFLSPCALYFCWDNFVLRIIWFGYWLLWKHWIFVINWSRNVSHAGKHFFATQSWDFCFCCFKRWYIKPRNPVILFNISIDFVSNNAALHASKSHISKNTCQSQVFFSLSTLSIVLEHKATYGLKSSVAIVWKSYNKGRDSSKRCGAWSIQQLASVKPFVVGALCPKNLAWHCVCRHHAIQADGHNYKQPGDHIWTSNVFSKSVVYSQEYFNRLLFCQHGQGEKIARGIKDSKQPSKSHPFFNWQNSQAVLDYSSKYLQRFSPPANLCLDTKSEYRKLFGIATVRKLFC